ncbi:MAG TPA: FAD-binding protein [Luteitalea sp.]|nr:FAD-binding protein [Luteitalea sp.]
MPRPSSVAELASLVPACARVAVRAGGTKPGLLPPDAYADTDASRRGAPTLIDASSLSGLVEYTPEECTFTALAGTPVREIEAALRPHGHHLPFDPPLADAGATIGGTVAAGINGSCRYRFGGIRDFIIGASSSTVADACCTAAARS